jgi:hypothetical protein
VACAVIPAENAAKEGISFAVFAALNAKAAFLLFRKAGLDFNGGEFPNA